jgi:hypothetical protein
MIAISRYAYCDIQIMITSISSIKNGTATTKTMDMELENLFADTNFGLFYIVDTNKITRYYDDNSYSDRAYFFIDYNIKIDDKQYIYARSSEQDSIYIILLPNDLAIVIRDSEKMKAIEEGLYIKKDMENIDSK